MAIVVAVSAAKIISIYRIAIANPGVVFMIGQPSPCPTEESARYSKRGTRR